MSRTAGSDGAKTMDAIRRAAIKRIYDHGFEAMKLRELAADVGIQAGSLYNYITQKEEFLYILLTEIMEELLSDLEATLNADTGPLESLQAFIAFHIRWHTARRMEVFIGNMELRSLSRKHYKEITALREKYEEILAGILVEGNRQGVWFVPDTKVATFAIIAMLTGVCTWYRPKGPLSQDDLVSLYTGLVVQGIALK